MTDTPADSPPVMLLPASTFSLPALAGAFNQGRSDYLVPMSTTPEKLGEYLRDYSVDLTRSWVAVDEKNVLGLAMLGVRPGCTWVTRLSVNPEGRRRGTGAALVGRLLDETRALGCQKSILEVIQGNEPARRLFLRFGFRETRELLVLRRPLGPTAPPPEGSPLLECAPTWLEGHPALALLEEYSEHLPWTNQPQSYIKAGGAQALCLDLSSGDNGGESGWLVFRLRGPLLSHFVFHTRSGSPPVLAAALLAHLYSRFPHAATDIENIPTADPHLPALARLGFVVAFKRMEMVWE